MNYSFDYLEVGTADLFDKFANLVKFSFENHALPSNQRTWETPSVSKPAWAAYSVESTANSLSSSLNSEVVAASQCCKTCLPTTAAHSTIGCLYLTDCFDRSIFHSSGLAY